MIPLRNHEAFEAILQSQRPITMIKFGATWCGPCKRIDKDILCNLSKDIIWYDCDLDENEDTPAYCGVEKIPSFLAIVKGEVKPLFQSSDTNQVIQWMRNGFKTVV